MQSNSYGHLTFWFIMITYLPLNMSLYLAYEANVPKYLEFASEHLIIIFVLGPMVLIKLLYPNSKIAIFLWKERQPRKN